MSAEPTVTLKPIGLKLQTAPSAESRQPPDERAKRGTGGKEKTDEYDNLFTGREMSCFMSLLQLGEKKVPREAVVISNPFKSTKFHLPKA